MNHDVVDLQASIKLRVPINNENEKKEYKIIDSTPGRAKLSSVIPKHTSVDYEIVNKLMKNVIFDPQKKNKLIFDGYPITLEQAKNL